MSKCINCEHEFDKIYCPFCQNLLCNLKDYEKTIVELREDLEHYKLKLCRLWYKNKELKKEHRAFTYADWERGFKAFYDVVIEQDDNYEPENPEDE